MYMYQSAVFDSLGNANILFCKKHPLILNRMYSNITLIEISLLMNNYRSVRVQFFFLPKRKLLNNSQPRAVQINILSIWVFLSDQEAIADKIRTFLRLGERPGVVDGDTSSSSGDEEDFEHVDPEELKDDLGKPL